MKSVKKNMMKVVALMCAVLVFAGSNYITASAASTAASSMADLSTGPQIVPGAVYYYTLEYYNEKEEWTSATIQFVFSTESPTQGSAVAVFGLPTDMGYEGGYPYVYFEYYGDYENEKLVEKLYGNDEYSDEPIVNGTVLYTITEPMDPQGVGLIIIIGVWDAVINWDEGIAVALW